MFIARYEFSRTFAISVAFVCSSLVRSHFDKSIIDTAIDDIAIDTIKEVGPDGHFFGCQHTQDRYETAFYQPMISDWSNFEAWDINGGVWTAERAHKVYKEIINELNISEESAVFIDDNPAEILEVSGNIKGCSCVSYESIAVEMMQS